MRHRHTRAIECWGTGTPTPVTGITDAFSLGVDTTATCAYLSSGAVKCWGTNRYGQLGAGTTVDSTTPVTVIGL